MRYCSGCYRRPEYCICHVVDPEEEMVDVTLFWYEVETLIARHFGQPFDFLHDQDAQNNREYQFVINGVLSKREEKDVKEYRMRGDGTLKCHILLNDLCRRGWIQPGCYTVRVSWNVNSSDVKDIGQD